MGLFDDLIGPLIEPIKEIRETVEQVKDDATKAIGQIGSDVSELKDRGGSALEDLSSTIKGSPASDNNSTQE